ncbi:MAG: hypothetical protein GH152_03290 [Dehalococcoidia bacterium]|nr:hypothetical protein [Dehalococcoidia bacterium]
MRSTVSQSPEPFTPRHSEGALRSPCHSERSEESHRSGQAPRLKNLTQAKLRERTAKNLITLKLKPAKEKTMGMGLPYR